jgi:CubicO group peptidase (beta-lactamase class C family)
MAGASSVSYQKYKEGSAKRVWKTTPQTGQFCNVAVMDEDKINYSEGFGAADRKSGRGVDRPHVQYRLTSKMFVAVSVLCL